MGTTRVLILTEGGGNIGFGHVMRTKAILEKFQEAQVPCDLWIDLDGPISLPEQHNVKLMKWRSADDLTSLLEAYSHVLIDSYRYPLDQLLTIRNSTGRLVALDDFGRIDEQVDLVINPNIYGAMFTYRGHALGGGEYVILREPFRKTIAIKYIKKKAQRLLITFGGNTHRQLVDDALSSLKNLELDVTILVGSAEIDPKLRADYTNVSFLGMQTAEDMVSNIIDHDIALSGCGQTLHELAVMGMPTVGICLAEDQRYNMRAYVDHGFLPEAIILSGNDPWLHVRECMELLMSFEKRGYLSKLGQGLVTKDGVDNVCKAILE